MTHPSSPEIRRTPAYEGPATTIRAIADFLGMTQDDVRKAVSMLKDDGELIDRPREPVVRARNVPPPRISPPPGAAEIPARTGRCDQCGRDLPSPRCRCK